MLNKHNSFCVLAVNETARPNTTTTTGIGLRNDIVENGRRSDVPKRANATLAIVGTLLLHIYHENICWPRPRRVTHGSKAASWLVNAPWRVYDSFVPGPNSWLSNSRISHVPQNVITLSLTIILHFHFIGRESVVHGKILHPAHRSRLGWFKLFIVIKKKHTGLAHCQKL